MSPELQNKLFSKYYKIFGRKDLPMNQTAMCWGIDCDDGWYNILDVLCSQIQCHLDWKNRQKMYAGHPAKSGPEQSPEDAQVDESCDTEVSQVQADQVKEKFGTLRFYACGGDDYTEGLINMAEALSARTCEVCGSPGRQTVGGWNKTLCPVHAHELGRTLEEDDIDDDGEGTEGAGV